MRTGSGSSRTSNLTASSRWILVGMSYLLAGTGPVKVDGRVLTSENVVEELLNRPYLDLDPLAQDRFFEAAARAIFDAATDNLASPVDFLEGFQRAASEGRFLVASFNEQDTRLLDGQPRSRGIIGRRW